MSRFCNHNHLTIKHLHYNLCFKVFQNISDWQLLNKVYFISKVTFDLNFVPELKRFKLLIWNLIMSLLKQNFEKQVKLSHKGNVISAQKSLPILIQSYFFSKSFRWHGNSVDGHCHPGVHLHWDEHHQNLGDQSYSSWMQQSEQVHYFRFVNGSNKKRLFYSVKCSFLILICQWTTTFLFTIAK